MRSPGPPPDDWPAAWVRARHWSATAEVGAQTFTVLAEELDGTARAELWPKLVAWAPNLGEYQARTARQIPVAMLTRQD